MKVRTECQNCYFKKVTEDRQTGCNFNDRLQTFLERKEAYIKDNGFYVIDRVCNAFIPNDFDVKSLNTDNIIERVNQELEIGVHVIVYSDNDDEKEIKSIIKNISLQKLKPKKITTFLNPNSKIVVSTLYKDIASILLSSDIVFQITKTIDYHGTVSNFIKILERDSKNSFFCFVNDSSNIDDNFFKDINKFVNYDLEKIGYVTNNKMISFNTKILYAVMQKAFYNGNNYSISEIPDIAKNFVDLLIREQQSSVRGKDASNSNNTTL